MNRKKIAVVLLNLGGPLAQKDIKPFLFNFFMDKNIISAPLFIRYFIAKYISISRGKGAAKSAYALLGYKSPLLENTQKQATALEKILLQSMDVKVFISMRYWHPQTPAVVKEVKEYQPDEVVLLPLYPQYSTTTTNSSFEEWDKVAVKNNLTIKTRRVGCYPDNPGFIKASVQRIKELLEKAPKGTRLLFSAHGLPEKIIEGGDPYQWQCEKSAQWIVAALAQEGFDKLDWQICYQSRVGPLKWIGPSTEEALEKAGADKVGVLIYPHAFVSEHVETLVEIEMEYRHFAKEKGVPWFEKVETVGTHPDFIGGLADEILKLQGEKICRDRICPAEFKKCGCKGS